MEIIFHHSNAELPLPLERWLSRLVVTPRLHGIHHSIVPDERDCNWSSGLTIWDWLHRPLRVDVPQSDVTIGVPAYRDPSEVTLPRIITMPFTEQRPSDRLPDGTRPMPKSKPSSGATKTSE